MIQPSELSSNNLPRLAVTQKQAARALGVCVDTIETLVARGELERVRLTSRMWGITWRSLVAKVHGVEAA